MNKKYYCNPINIDYKYQFYSDYQSDEIKVAKEAADPSLIMYQDKYYLFASMTLSVFVSEDMVNWEEHRLPEYLPLYDYAPDVRVVGDTVYFSASKRDEICDFYKTKDIINGPYEKIEGSFDFWDPNLFVDNDDRLYFYYGCTNYEPLWGVELDRKTLKPIGEKVALIEGNPYEIGYERVGNKHDVYPKSDSEIEIIYKEYLKHQNVNEEDLSEKNQLMLKNMLSNKPFIEGAWIDYHKGKYYLQYAAPGTQYDGYADGVYISDNPLGPFELAKSNPFSYKPSGFITGAGHGSTMEDKHGNLWHASTQVISINHNFERRIGIWPAGFDKDGVLFCNQNYGDFPRAVIDGQMDPWEDPDWMLLSYNKNIKASSSVEDNPPENAVDENIKTWWQSDETEGWLLIDLEDLACINAVQINFADTRINMDVPGKIKGTSQARFIEDRNLKTRWKLESSIDGETFDVIKDNSKSNKNLAHDLVIPKEKLIARYLKLSIYEVPYGQKPSISGLRVFGKIEKKLSNVPKFKAIRINDLDMEIEIKGDALGYNVLWGIAPDKLYNSYLSFENKLCIGALIKNQEYYIRVDAFNEAGITLGEVVKL